jgi:hypothetical protein
MGNWHCVPSGCAEVVYQEYLPPSIRWRYPGEDWQEILGDDYKINENLTGQCSTKYKASWITNVFGSNTKCSNSSAVLFGPYNVWGPVSGVIFKNPRGNCGAYESMYLLCHGLSSQPRKVDQIEFLIGSNSVLGRYANAINFQVVLDDNQPDNCGNCTFMVTKNGNIVHQETRSVCPEVEKLPCRLSDVVKTIEIEKLPYLERIEVRNQSIEPIYLPPANVPLLDVKSLPNECLNIYNTYILAPPFLSDYVPLPGIINPYQYIAQICSAPGCSPPQYQVICDCECQVCPDNTHPITCGDSICCYGSDGIAVKTISIDDYCGGDSCD